jgi:hypothetical protein
VYRVFLNLCRLSTFILPILEWEQSDEGRITSRWSLGEYCVANGQVVVFSVGHMLILIHFFISVWKLGAPELQMVCEQ